MAENVGHAEVDVTLDVDRLVSQGRDAGEDAGEAYGDSFFRAADGRLRDSRGRFVSESRRSGSASGDAFGDGFSKGLTRAFRGGGNPFTGLAAQAELQSNRILATFVRLGPLIAGALGAAFAVGPALAVAVPALAALVAAVGVFALGWDEVTAAVLPLQQMFIDLGAPIGRLLADGVKPLVKELSGNLFPVLKSGLGEIATVLNGVITGFINWANSAETLGQLETLLVGLAGPIGTLGQLVIVLADAFLQIAISATPAFVLLTDALLAGAVAFNEWITALAESGQLTASITGSMEVLGGVISAIGRVLGSAILFFNDLGPAGVAALQGIADVLVFVLDALRPLAQFLSQNAEAVRQFAIVLGTLVLASAGLQTIALFLTGAVGALSALAAALVIAYNNSALFRQAVSEIAAFAQGQLLPALQAIAGFITGTIVPALQQFGAFLQANVLPPLLQFATFVQTQVIPAVTSLATFFGQIGAKLGEFITFLQPVIEFLAGQFIPALVRLGEAFGELFGAVVQLGQALGPVLKPALIAIGAILIGGLLVAFAQIIIVITAVTFAIRIFAAGIRIVAQVVGAVVGAVQGFIGVLQQVAGFVAGVFAGALATARSLLSGLAGVVRTVISAVSSLIGFVSNLIGRLAAIPGSIPMPFGAWDFITTVIGWVEDLIGFLGDIPGSLPNPLDWDLGGVLGAVGDIVGLLGDIPSSLPNPFDGWDIPSIPDFSLPGPLAFGGIFDRPYNAIVGEAGKEVVVPLTKPQRALNLLEQSGAADLLRGAGRLQPEGGGMTYAPHIELTVPTDDPETVAEQLINRMSSRVVM